jgi:hypothetical protein
MSTLMQANRQWSTRPADERFTSLVEMLAHFQKIRGECRNAIMPSRRIHCLPDPDNRGLMITGPNGHAYTPTHWAFGQLAQRAEAPAGYLRTLPAPIAADCINFGLQFKREIDDIGCLLQRNGDDILRAVTGPNYGRIWNESIAASLVDRFGDGVSGDTFRVPGEFGRAVTVTKDNTTLFAGDRDMFVFLADEAHRIDFPDRRNGEPGTLARGFFVWNSEVGSATFGLATFLFDYVCCNRIVWGAKQFKQVTIRHTSSAPDRWLDKIAPALTAYANSSAATVTQAIEHARAARLGDKLDDFLSNRFSRAMGATLKRVHEEEEGRPIETLWDVVTAATAHARSIKWQDQRVDLERKAGDIIDLAS